MSIFYVFVVLLYIYKKVASQKLLTKRVIGVIIFVENTKEKDIYA